MEQILDDHEVSGSEIQEKELLKTIWTQPTATLDYLVKYNPEKYVMPLLVISGIASALDEKKIIGITDTSSLLGSLALSIIGGGLLGWLFYYLYAWILSVTGKWIKGEAIPESFRTVIAWSSIPAICSNLLIIPHWISLNSGIIESTDILSIITWVILMGYLVLGCWPLVILIKGIILIQKFSIGKAILNLVLGAIVLFVPIVVLAFVVFGVIR